MRRANNNWEVACPMKQIDLKLIGHKKVELFGDIYLAISHISESI